ncbi:hypothetical protein GCWU000341_02306 [Oribacterium sp. oral taxon 078 str. F0262]|uniref:hypothetical protein n=1 Tax=Oribacterium sp. oral taxon 078 TaxID=652706 RepID=UPI0001CDEE00|nr:hypothetical protein [Oribacterium sp. oral taxon 078]EFE91198.1 hypothetical protein GCWU000341_02306 [Oribacterium sp. oral taxon 078 str. F0262]
MYEDLKCEIKRLHESPNERQRAMREYDEKCQHLQKHFWDDWERTTAELAQKLPAKGIPIVVAR